MGLADCLESAIVAVDRIYPGFRYGTVYSASSGGLYNSVYTSLVVTVTSFRNSCSGGISNMTYELLKPLSLC